MKYLWISNVLSRSENSSPYPFKYKNRLAPILQSNHPYNGNVTILGEYELEISIEQILQRVKTKPQGDSTMRSCLWLLITPFICRYLTIDYGHYQVVLVTLRVLILCKTTSYQLLCRKRHKVVMFKHV